MNGTTLERPDVAAYLDAVRARLADLPAEERDDLVADVEESLLESGEPPRLSPQDFAAELREAAGLGPEAAQAVQTSPFDALRAWLSSERAAAWGRSIRELAPIWWLVRAYVAVVVLALATAQGWPVGSGTSGSPIPFGQSVVALLVTGAISIWLGLRGRRGSRPYRRLAVAANVALALAAVPVAVHSLGQLSVRSHVPPDAFSEPVRGVAVDGIPIRNIYPYSRDGKPLFDVLLYSEYGQPIEVRGEIDPWRRILLDDRGTPHFNTFPVRYFEPGTKTVARPALAPNITLPRIFTPPLDLPSK